jgi:hypothetical protein
MDFEKFEGSPKTWEALEEAEAEKRERFSEGSAGDLFMKGIMAADDEIVSAENHQGE